MKKVGDAVIGLDGAKVGGGVSGEEPAVGFLSEVVR